MIKIVSDSSCNIQKMEGFHFTAVPMTIYTDERSFSDDENLNLTEMLDYLAQYKARSYTSCPNVEAWLQSFEGGTEIYAVTLTSTLSGTYNAAMTAKQLYEQEHPGVKVDIFDTKSTGPEMHLVLDKIAELVAAGGSFEENCKKIRAYMEHTSLFFALGSLHNLAVNGRVNKVVASAAGVLGIRIISRASEIGDIKPITKGRGEKRAAIKMYEEIVKAGYRGGKMKIAHIECPSIAEIFMERVRKDYPHADLECYCTTGLCGYYAEREGLMIGAELE